MWQGRGGSEDTQQGRLRACRGIYLRPAICSPATAPPYTSGAAPFGVPSPHATVRPPTPVSSTRSSARVLEGPLQQEEDRRRLFAPAQAGGARHHPDGARRAPQAGRHHARAGRRRAPRRRRARRALRPRRQPGREPARAGRRAHRQGARDRVPRVPDAPHHRVPLGVGVDPAAPEDARLPPPPDGPGVRGRPVPGPAFSAGSTASSTPTSRGGAGRSGSASPGGS